MKDEKRTLFTEVRLKKNARFSDGIPVPRRFKGGTYQILSRGKRTALLSELDCHVEWKFLTDA